MFRIKQKLDKNLNISINNNRFKNYRVIIHCSNFLDKLQTRINAFNGEIIGAVPSINCVFAIVSERCIERLLEYPEVKYITFDDFGYLCGEKTSNIQGVNLSHKLKFTGKGVCIGLVDSGVYPHTELMVPTKKIIKFLDMVNGHSYPYDDNGHGTFMSGIICSNGNNSNVKCLGIAPNSTIYNIKAFNALGKAYISNILLAINILICESKELGLKVICLPFETNTHDDFILSLFYKIFNIAIENNITIVVPSGSNENIKSSISGIATLSNCITVGGIDTSSETFAYKYSSCGPCGKLMKPDLSYPCVNIHSLNSDKQYVSERNGVKLYPRKFDELYTVFSGTSCAAAYISGICALLFESNCNLRYKDIVSLIKASCKLLKYPKWQQGEGILDLDFLFKECE